MPPSSSLLKLQLNTWFVQKTNLEISQLSLPYVQQISSFTRSRYVVEHQGCPTLARFLFGCAGLGNRAPRPGRNRTTRCSLCNGTLSESHVAFVCPRMDDYCSNHTDISVFIAMCRAKAILPLLAFKWYVTGLDWSGNPVSTALYLKRGQTLENLTTEWLRRTWFWLVFMALYLPLLSSSLCYHFFLHSIPIFHLQHLYTWTSVITTCFHVLYKHKNLGWCYIAYII